MSKSYVTFIDNSGRNILGVVESENDNTILIQNPTMVLVQPQNGTLQVQLIPLFLSEFVSPKDGNNRNFTFEYNKSQVAIGRDFTVDPRIIEQYDRIMSGAFAQPQKATSDTPEVIKLFDE